jgi:DNA replication protein DnaC
VSYNSNHCFLSIDTNVLSKLSQAIKDCGKVTGSNTEALKSDIDYLCHEENLEKRVNLLAWISSTDFSAQQADYISRRQKGTGQWFLNAPEFAQWLKQPNGTLFCPGIPGAGKTMMASIAIDYLLKTVQADSVGVAYVYCNYKPKKSRTWLTYWRRSSNSWYRLAHHS